MKKLVYRYKRTEDGAAAIEFSLLALPFVFTCVCIIELGLYFGSAFILESAVMDASRLIKTGALQDSNTADQEALFADALCGVAGSLLNCNRLQYEVRKLDSFTEPLDATYNDEGDLDEPQFEAAAITAGCVGLVRVAYRYRFITPLFGNFFGDNGTTRLLLSTTVFRSEPYKFQADENCSV